MNKIISLPISLKYLNPFNVRNQHYYRRCMQTALRIRFKTIARKQNYTALPINTTCNSSNISMNLNVDMTA